MNREELFRMYYIGAVQSLLQSKDGGAYFSTYFPESLCVDAERIASEMLRVHKKKFRKKEGR